MSKFKTLSKQEQDTILNCIAELHEMAVNSKVRYRVYGICFELERMLEEYGVSLEIWNSYYDSCHIYSTWPEGTGDVIYPVPKTTDGNWEGEQLKLRLSLLKFMFNSLYNEALETQTTN